jgi:hypothetical protein
MAEETRMDDKEMCIRARDLYAEYRSLCENAPGKAAAEGLVPLKYFEQVAGFHRRAREFRQSGGRICDLRKGRFQWPAGAER